MGVYLHSSQFMNKQCGYSSLVHLSTTNCPLPYASSPLGTSKGEVSRSNHQATPLLQDMWLDINTNHSESGYLVPKSVYNICMQIFASIYSGEMAWYIWSKLYKYVKWPSCMHLSWHLQTELSKKGLRKKTSSLNPPGPWNGCSMLIWTECPLIRSYHLTLEVKLKAKTICMYSLWGLL